MKINLSNSDEFERLIDGLARDIVDAAIHYRLYRDLRDSVATFKQELNQSPAFWSLTFGAHLDSARARLFRAYDQRPGTLCLRNLIETIRENLDLFGPDGKIVKVFVRGASPPDLAELDRDLSLVVPSNPLVKKLVALRGNLYAHRNAENVARQLKIEERFPLSYTDFDSLVQRAVTILNRYSQLFRFSTWSTRIVGHDDFRHVLKSVRESISRHEEAILEEIRQDGLSDDESSAT